MVGGCISSGYVGGNCPRVGGRVDCLSCDDCVNTGWEDNVEHPICRVWAMDCLEGSGELIDIIDQQAR